MISLKETRKVPNCGCTNTGVSMYSKRKAYLVILHRLTEARVALTYPAIKFGNTHVLAVAIRLSNLIIQIPYFS